MSLTAVGPTLAQAATGGGGSSSGGGSGLLASASTIMIAKDGFNGFGQPTLQGRGQASIDYFWDETVTAFQDQLGRTPGTQGVRPGLTPQDSFNEVCGAALQNAADRASAMGHAATAADSRVVGVYFSYAVGTTNWFISSVPESEYSDSFSPSWNNEVNNPAAPGFSYQGDRSAYAGFQQDGMPALDAIAATWRSHVDAVLAQTPVAGRYFTCVALNEFEPQEQFQPVVSSQVQTVTVSKGENLADQVSVGVAAGDTWANVGGQNVTVKARGTLYGPLSHAAATSTTVPGGAPVAATAMVDFGGPGTQTYNWTATASGTYAWVWEVRKDDQGANAQYLRADARDSYFAASEQFQVRMAPQLSTQVVDRHSDDATYLARDTVTVSLPAGDAWLADSAGNNLPLRVRVTAYGPYNTPAAAQAATPADAPAVGTEVLTYTAPGSKSTSGTIKRTGPGFYTYVAEVRVEDQLSSMQAVLAGPVKDAFMLEPETTSARWVITHYSEAREYNVAIGGRAFDTVTTGGFADDHATWQGLGGWGADLSTATVTVYGPTENMITTAAVPAGTPVLMSTTVPARNGTYNIGYSAGDIVNPNLPGHYVFVYSFAGDERTQAFTSPANDIREQFYVPANGGAWLDVLSTATQNATAGSGTITDQVLVTGNSVPAGSTLTWQTCMWTDPSAPGCAQPTSTYSTTVDSTGFYNHPDLPTPTIADLPAGALVAYYGWAPVLTSSSGQVLDRETFGNPAQTTTIRASVPGWSSQATTTAKLGDTVSDTVTFEGPTRSDWTVRWDAAWLDQDGNPIDGTTFTVGDPVPVDPAHPTVKSPDWTVAIPAGTKPGTQLRLGWQPVLVDGIGAELAREPWGTDGQVTVVDYPLPTMTSQATKTAVLGETSQDTVTVTGPTLAGDRVVWEPCYLIAVDGQPAACRQDATPLPKGPVLEDGTVGVVLPALGVGETLTVKSQELKVGSGGLLPDAGLRLTWVPQIVSTSGEVRTQEATGLPAQTTTVTFPPITATTKAYYSPVNPAEPGPVYGDAIGDRVTVAGDILPGDQVSVRLYAWESGTPPLCTGEPLKTVALDLTPAASTYDTGLIYTTDPKRPNLTYGFVETVVSRGTTTTSECGLAAETVGTTRGVAGSSAGGAALASTGANVLAGAAWGLGAVFLGAGLLFAARKARRRSGAAITTPSKETEA